jgi:fimbrial chaperone protein
VYSTLRRVVLGIACFAGAASAALAGSFLVSPVRVEFAPAQPTTVLRVSNTGAEPVTVQAEVKTWSYAGEEDVFADSDDVLLNPPIFTIAAGATQFVRVGLRSRKPPTSEATYRLFLEELPPPPKPGEMGVRTLLRISLPIFVAPPGARAAPKLQWRVTRAGPDEVLLSATNTGTAHIQLQAISLRPQGVEAVASQNLAAYLLPGQTREWKIPGKAIGTAAQIELSARSDAGELNERLAPADR